MSVDHGSLLLAHVVPHIYEEASGPSQSVVALCGALADLGHQVDLNILAPLPPTIDTRVTVYAYSDLAIARRFGVSFSMWRALNRSARNAAIVHNHSLWMFPNIASGLAVGNASAAKLVISPRGTLSAWALRRSRWRKRAVWWLLGQRYALTRAACFHATAESEAEDIRRLGFRQPIAIIPNGIEVPPTLPSPDGRGPERLLLFLSRVNPKKGIDTLLQAWASLASRFPAWRLVIAGPSSPPGYSDAMQAFAAQLGVERVSFVGPVYGEDKARLHAQADLFVLPTHSENFGLVVGEALAHARPAITTKAAPWQGLEQHRCGWWIEDSRDALAVVLGHALSLDRAALDDMGGRGRIWMQRDFGWDGIARQMSDVYRWLRGNGERPACVEVD